MPIATLQLVSRTHGAGTSKPVTIDKEDGNPVNHLGLFISPELMALASLNKDINVPSSSSGDCFLAAEAEVSALNGYTLDATTEYPPHYWNGTRWVSGGLNFTYAFPILIKTTPTTNTPMSIPTRLGGTTLKTDFLLVVSG